MSMWVCLKMGAAHKVDDDIIIIIIIVRYFPHDLAIFRMIGHFNCWHIMVNKPLTPIWLHCWPKVLTSP